jgi:hypothetical protein
MRSAQYPGLQIWLASFAPLDLPQKWTKREFMSLFRILAVPPAFVEERLRQVSHSFGSMNDPHGSCAWFHFLCKQIEITTSKAEEGTMPAVAYHPDADPSRGLAKDSPMQSYDSANSSADILVAAEGENGEPLPQADYSYLRSGFFLRTTPAGNVTLCCFGATENVRRILYSFMESSAWSKISTEPYAFFDLIMAGLFIDVDQNVWNINIIFGAFEHVSLVSAEVVSLVVVNTNICVILEDLSQSKIS